MRAIRNPVLVGLTVLLATGCQPQGEASEASSQASVQAPASARLNTMITLHEEGAPVFGLYAPRPTPFRGREAPAPGPSEIRSPAEIAGEILSFQGSDYVFHSEMEGGVDRALPGFQALVSAMHSQGATARTHPFVVKMEKISEDPRATEHVGQQLAAGVSSVMFVEVESAEELQVGLDAMRFRSRGGTREEGDLGMAPGYWGLSEAEYRERADLWPLNPQGELIAWVIIESREGLANLREIAAVPGIGVLWPGAGTLRGVFTSTAPDGTRVFDEEGWEGAIQDVLAACREFNLRCGFPASPENIESRMAQGFEVFVMNWGEAGFRTLEMGRAVGRR